MNGVFKKLAKEIKFDITPTFENVQVTSANLAEGNIFELNLSSREIIPFNEMKKFLVALNTNFKYKTKFTFDVLSVVYKENEFRDYADWIIKSFLQKPHLARIIEEAEIYKEGNDIKIMLPTITQVNQIEDVRIDLDRILSKFGYKDFDVHASLVPMANDIIDQEKKRNQQQAQQEMEKAAAQPKKADETEFNRSRGYEAIKISELSESRANNVVIAGEIFNVNHIETKTDLVITQLSVTDHSDAIYVKMFARTPKDKEKNRKYEKGDYVTIKGQYQIDSYTKEPTIIARTITKIGNPAEQRKDKASTKRIELNMKTKMSTMDGIVSATDIVKRAKAWGHEALAIVDTDSLQSFPDFYNATKNDKDIKAIFGGAFDVITKENGAIINPVAKDLASENYVVFDLETTGLSPIFNEIIEFGATKVMNGKVIERKQFFVKPVAPISEFTTKLTNITQEMVDSAKPESEAILDIADYLKGNTAVAHNANFDITFVNQKLEQYGHEPLDVPVVDTMIVARIIEPEAKRFKLGTVASRMNVNYDPTVAHRGDYDAEVTAYVWIKMIKRLAEMGINKQHELFAYRDDSLYSKVFSNNVSLLAKNQKGLKELFNIASKAFTEKFYKGPKVFIEDLKNRENVLMGSGGLGSRLIDRLFFGSKRQVINEIELYDYIEVQPVDNFKHLINRGIPKENIEKAIRMVIDIAKEKGIPVIATSDARYLDPQDKIYHDVYINAKGLGGVRHPLFKFNEINPVYPELYLRTTEEMMDAFVFLDDARLIKEIVVTNTHLIADMCSEPEVIKNKLYKPTFGDSGKKLSDLAYKTARKTYGDELPEIVEKRLERELEPLKKYGYSVIYWISHLLVKKSLDDGYLVGSRGSVGSSLVATMTSITEVNPLAPHYVCTQCRHSEFFPESTLNSGYDLPDKLCPNCSDVLMKKDGQNIPFETFLGFDADKVPDIDLNYSGEYQPTIHNEVKVLFGESHAFRAGTISTVAEKTAFGYVKAWAEETDKNLSRPFIEYIAKGVAGTKRTSGQHPGGIIVIPQEFDVEDFTPINYPANDVNSAWKTTHFDFHAIHDNVLKLDLLGHVDPTAIKYLEKLTGVDALTIPFSDDKIISLFSSTESLGIKPSDIDGETTGAMGIPEFGTKFVRGMLKSTTVSSFGDLISVSGLSHGTDVWANNAELLIKAEGKTLSDTISCRDNIMTDLLAKDVEPIQCFTIMEKVRKGKGVTEDEIKMMKEHGVEDWYIDSLQKIKYMFPKAHATAYVMMAWRIAWFKLYHPVAYYATYFSTRADATEIEIMHKGKDEVVERLKDLSSRRYVRGEGALTNKEQSLIPVMEIANEMYARGFNIKNIDLRKSDPHNWVLGEDGKSIIPPFSVVDGLGDSVAQSIIDARKEGDFTSKQDLTNRTSLNKTSIKKLEALNVLDGLSETNQITFDLF